MQEKKKKIAVIVEYFPPRLGGDRRIFEIMKRLSSKYEIHFIAMPPSYTTFIRKIDTANSQDNVTYCAGMTGHNLHIPKMLSVLWEKNFLQAFVLTMSFLLLKTTTKIAKLKPDLVIITHTSAYTGLLGFLSSKILRKKLLVEYNDLQALYTFDMVQEKIPKSFRFFAKSALMVQEDIIVKHGWKVTAITSFIKKYASGRKTRFDIQVIPDGVDTQIFNPSLFDRTELRTKYSLSDSDTVCLYAGRIDWVAGSGLLVETAKLMKAYSNVKFMIVGEGNHELVNAFKKSENVLYVGPVSKDDVPKYLASADIVLVPFPKSIASHSISPLKLFEALSMGKPVVASNISGIAEVVHHGFHGALVSDDPNEWSSAIIRLANDPALINVHNDNRKLVLEKYDWALLAENFSAVIDA